MMLLNGTTPFTSKEDVCFDNVFIRIVVSFWCGKKVGRYVTFTFENKRIL